MPPLRWLYSTCMGNSKDSITSALREPLQLWHCTITALGGLAVAPPQSSDSTAHQPQLPA